MGNGPEKPVCVNCPHDLYYKDTIPKRQFNVMMRMGEHYCTGGKKARRFKRNDPKVYTPAWCPKRKTPCELRVYGFRSEDDELIHRSLCTVLGYDILPSESRYRLEQSLHTELTPREFWKRCDLEPSEELLSLKVALYHVLEIDDGLNPAFFYKTERGFEYLSLFRADQVQKSKKGDSD